jgi:hypothetical protein
VITPKDGVEWVRIGVHREVERVELEVGHRTPPVVRLHLL